MDGLVAGRMVHYVLRQQDAEQINRRRVHGVGHAENWPAGAQAHVGNTASAGDHYPMVVVCVWPHEFGERPGVNGQVFLDGNDQFWVTSAEFTDTKEPGTCHWIEGD